MGLAGISPWSIAIIVAIAILLFGTKRIRDAGTDLGGFFGGFKRSIRELSEDDDDDNPPKVS